MKIAGGENTTRENGNAAQTKPKRVTTRFGCPAHAATDPRRRQRTPYATPATLRGTQQVPLPLRPNEYGSENFCEILAFHLSFFPLNAQVGKAMVQLSH